MEEINSMIKIKLYQLDKHRNEIAFRPYIWAKEILREIGIELTTDSSYDYAMIAQASYIDKSLTLNESVSKGEEYLSKITGDYILLDGQDSTSMMGTIDVFRRSNAKLFLKNTLLKDWDLYKKGWKNGRIYWGEGEYSVPDIDKLKVRDLSM